MSTPQIPALFLSHSGAQKDFTWRLYHELVHVNHNPFFDQDARDSLPKGQPFPSRIVEACRACKLGIVVVSHEYIESLWPMLELQQLLFHNPNSPNNVYPVFYKLKPADLSKQENLAQWQSVWERLAPSWHAKMLDLHIAASSISTSNVQPTLDISLWPKALEILRSQSGEILPNNNKDEHTFIQTIVRNICNRLPPPHSFLMGDHFKGAEHIQQEIHELFQQQERIDDTPTAVGVHGVGGSGKTTMCKYMLSFYNSKAYVGSCCFLQFPSLEGDESQLLLKSIKEVLAECGNWAKESLEKIHSVEQAMPHLQELLKRCKLFLVLDNVWDWALQRAKQIMTMHYMPGSRLLVTARSERLLQTLSSSIRIHVNEVVGRLPAMQIVHVPSISEEEAAEALMAYSMTSSQYVTNAEDLRRLARSCFFAEQCHPLLLKAVGAKLRHLGGQIRSAEDWTQLILRLQAHRIQDDEEIEGTVLNVLKTSFDALHSNKLRDTFLNLGTCVPIQSNHLKFENLSDYSKWLSMLSHSGSYSMEDIRDQLVELEYHGLIQIQGERLVIHDLQMMLIENIVKEKKDVPRCFFFEGGVGTLLKSDWTRIRYISTFLKDATDLTQVLSPQRRRLEHIIMRWFPFDPRATSPNWPNIEILCLEESWFSGQRLSMKLSVKHMESLRYLELNEVIMLKELGGWHGAPNLVSVKLFWCEELEKIESMACLPLLESVGIESCRCIRSRQFMTNLSSCENLKRFVIKDNYHLKHLASVGHLQKLQKLGLSDCRDLVDVGTHSGGGEGRSVCGLSTALEELDFGKCRKLERIPDLKQVVKLRRLNLKNCDALKEVKLGDAALTTLEFLALQINSCRLMNMSVSLPVSAFTNLRYLWAYGGSCNISMSNLPVSLETLKLIEFETAEEITIGALVNLKRLHVRFWPSLTKITGLGLLTKLTQLSINSCPKLETMITMGHLTFVNKFSFMGHERMWLRIPS